ncbi:MAG: DUF5697 family protein [Enterocloster sp.]|uniref:DUF5697 family protein n=1 Tax=Enterocloster sp. TaxID=2719315 RepID=UPI00399BFABD
MGELYEVAYVAHGQEALVCRALRGNKGGSRRIILVDSPTQIAKIDCHDISGFCTVSQDGPNPVFQESRRHMIFGSKTDFPQNREHSRRYIPFE